MGRLKDLLKEEFETNMSSMEKSIYIETLDQRVKLAQ
jgi:hypothetical protein